MKPTHIKGFCLKALSVVLCAAMVSTSSDLAQAAGALTAPRVLNPATFRLPASLGTVVDSYTAGDSLTGLFADSTNTNHRISKSANQLPFVVVIQDLHVYQPVQRKIRDILEFLFKQPVLKDTRVVGVEGAAGRIPTLAEAARPNPALKRKVADYLIEQGELTGAEAYAIEQGRGDLLWGVENDPYYEADRKLYLMTLQARKDLKTRLEYLDARLSEVAGKLDEPAAVQEVTQAEQALEEGAVQPEEVLKDWLKQGADLPLSVGPYPRLRALAQMMGAVTPAEAGVQPNTLDPRFRGDDNIKLTETQKLDIIQELLTFAPEFKAYLSSDKRSRNAFLAQKSLRFLINYLSQQATDYDVLAWTRHTSEMIARVKALGLLSDQEVAELTHRISNQIDFYSLALVRNEPMVKNLLTQMALRAHGSGLRKPEQVATATAEPTAQSAVLVAGGFHTRGVTDLLRKAGVSYVVIAPAIDSDPKPAYYALYEERLADHHLSADQIAAGVQQALGVPSAIAVGLGLKGHIDTVRTAFSHAFTAPPSRTLPLEGGGMEGGGEPAFASHQPLLTWPGIWNTGLAMLVLSKALFGQNSPQAHGLTSLWPWLLLGGLFAAVVALALKPRFDSWWHDEWTLSPRYKNIQSVAEEIKKHLELDGYKPKMTKIYSKANDFMMIVIKLPKLRIYIASAILSKSTDHYFIQADIAEQGVPVIYETNSGDTFTKMAVEVTLETILQILGSIKQGIPLDIKMLEYHAEDRQPAAPPVPAATESAVPGPARLSREELTKRIRLSLAPSPPKVNPRDSGKSKLNDEESFLATGWTVEQLPDMLDMLITERPGTRLVIEEYTGDAQKPAKSSIELILDRGSNITAIVGRAKEFAQEKLAQARELGEPLFRMQDWPDQEILQRPGPITWTVRVFPHDQGSPERYYRLHPPKISPLRTSGKLPTSGPTSIYQIKKVLLPYGIYERLDLPKEIPIHDSSVKTPNDLLDHIYGLHPVLRRFNFALDIDGYEQPVNEPFQWGERNELRYIGGNSGLAAEWNLRATQAKSTKPANIVEWPSKLPLIIGALTIGYLLKGALQMVAQSIPIAGLPAGQAGALTNPEGKPTMVTYWVGLFGAIVLVLIANMIREWSFDRISSKFRKVVVAIGRILSFLVGYTGSLAIGQSFIHSLYIGLGIAVIIHLIMRKYLKPAVTDEVTLMVVRDLGNNATAATIKKEIEQRIGKPVSVRAISVPLSRLENQGLVSSSLSEPYPELGEFGKRNYYRIEPKGLEALTRLESINQASLQFPAGPPGTSELDAQIREAEQVLRNAESTSQSAQADYANAMGRSKMDSENHVKHQETIIAQGRLLQADDALGIARQKLLELTARKKSTAPPDESVPSPSVENLHVFLAKAWKLTPKRADELFMVLHQPGSGNLFYLSNVIDMSSYHIWLDVTSSDPMQILRDIIRQIDDQTLVHGSAESLQLDALRAQLAIWESQQPKPAAPRSPEPTDTAGGKVIKWPTSGGKTKLPLIIGALTTLYLLAGSVLSEALSSQLTGALPGPHLQNQTYPQWEVIGAWIMIVVLVFWLLPKIIRAIVWEIGDEIRVFKAAVRVLREVVRDRDELKRHGENPLQVMRDRWDALERPSLPEPAATSSTHGLSDLELVVLRIIRDHGGSTYINPIWHAVEKRTGKSIPLFGISTTLDQLESKGYVSDWEGAPTEVRSWIPPRGARITTAGKKALAATESRGALLYRIAGYLGFGITLASAIGWWWVRTNPVYAVWSPVLLIVAGSALVLGILSSWEATRREEGPAIAEERSWDVLADPYKKEAEHVDASRVAKSRFGAAIASFWDAIGVGHGDDPTRFAASIEYGGLSRRELKYYRTFRGLGDLLNNVMEEQRLGRPVPFRLEWVNETKLTSAHYRITKLPQPPGYRVRWPALPAELAAKPIIYTPRDLDPATAFQAARWTRGVAPGGEVPETVFYKYKFPESEEEQTVELQRHAMVVKTVDDKPRYFILYTYKFAPHDPSKDKMKFAAVLVDSTGHKLMPDCDSVAADELRTGAVGDWHMEKLKEYFVKQQIKFLSRGDLAMLAIAYDPERRPSATPRIVEPPYSHRNIRAMPAATSRKQPQVIFLLKNRSYPLPVAGPQPLHALLELLKQNTDIRIGEKSHVYLEDQEITDFSQLIEPGKTLTIIQPVGGGSGPSAGQAVAPAKLTQPSNQSIATVILLIRGGGHVIASLPVLLDYLSGGMGLEEAEKALAPDIDGELLAASKYASINGLHRTGWTVIREYLEASPQVGGEDRTDQVERLPEPDPRFIRALMEDIPEGGAALSEDAAREILFSALRESRIVHTSNSTAASPVKKGLRLIRNIALTALTVLLSTSLSGQTGTALIHTHSSTSWPELLVITLYTMIGGLGILTLLSALKLLWVYVSTRAVRRQILNASIDRDPELAGDLAQRVLNKHPYAFLRGFGRKIDLKRPDALRSGDVVLIVDDKKRVSHVGMVTLPDKYDPANPHRWQIGFAPERWQISLGKDWYTENLDLPGRTVFRLATMEQFIDFQMQAARREKNKGRGRGSEGISRSTSILLGGASIVVGAITLGVVGAATPFGWVLVGAGAILLFSPFINSTRATVLRVYQSWLARRAQAATVLASLNLTPNLQAATTPGTPSNELSQVADKDTTSVTARMRAILTAA